MASTPNEVLKPSVAPEAANGTADKQPFRSVIIIMDQLQKMIAKHLTPRTFELIEAIPQRLLSFLRLLTPICSPQINPDITSLSHHIHNHSTFAPLIPFSPPIARFVCPLCASFLNGSSGLVG
jgi:hypothetical protein